MPKTEVFNRTEVLKKASIAFNLKGYNGTSMQDLVDSTGLNRSSIYNSFGSKLDLFLECLSHYESDFQIELNKLMLHSKSAMGLLHSILLNVVADSVYNKDRKGCLIGNCRTEMGKQNRRIDHFLIKNQSGTLTLLESIINKGQDEGSINTKKSPSEYALYVFSNMQGLRSVGIFLDQEKELNALVDTVLESLK